MVNLEYQPLMPYTIPGLSERSWCKGYIRIGKRRFATDSYHSELFHYLSDELLISGTIHAPWGKGPFPTIILNHGYVPPEKYSLGDKTDAIAEHLANEGFLVLAPAFRGWGNSNSGPNFFRAGMVIDTVNLINSLPTLESARRDKVGIWGHSMGAGVALKAAIVDQRIRTAVLTAPMSLWDQDIIERWGDVDFSMENGAKPLMHLYTKAMVDSAFLELTSPRQYLDKLRAVVQIHYGAKDMVAPKSWADEIAKQLTARRKTVDYNIYSDQDHNFHGPDLALMLERMVSFFRKYVSR
jgi:dipeptidyl aminopeptidase/acylaminoacyl peptidase